MPSTSGVKAAAEWCSKNIPNGEWDMLGTKENAPGHARFYFVSGAAAENFRKQFDNHRLLLIAGGADARLRGSDQCSLQMVNSRVAPVCNHGGSALERLIHYAGRKPKIVAVAFCRFLLAGSLIFCGLFVLVALNVGPIGTWTDTAVYCFAVTLGCCLYLALEERDIRRSAGDRRKQSLQDF